MQQRSLAVFLLSLCHQRVLCHLFCVFMQLQRNKPTFLSVSVFRSIYSPYKPTLPLYECSLAHKSCLCFFSTCRESSCCLSFSPSNLHKLHLQIFPTLSLSNRVDFAVLLPPLLPLAVFLAHTVSKLPLP